MLDPETIKKILDMRKDGNSLKQISRVLKLDSHTVRKYTVLYGLDGVECLNEAWTEEEDKMIRDLYLNQGLTATEIAVRMKKSYQGVRKYLLRHEIKQPRSYTPTVAQFSKPLPPPVIDPVYYPKKNITPKHVEYNGKKYLDVSEVYGI